MSAKIDAAPVFTFNLPSHVSAPDTRGSSFLDDLQSSVHQQGAKTPWGKADSHAVPSPQPSLTQADAHLQQNRGGASIAPSHAEEAPAAILYPLKLTAVGRLSYADAARLSETASIALTKHRMIKAAVGSAVQSPLSNAQTVVHPVQHTHDRVLQDQPAPFNTRLSTAEDGLADPIPSMTAERALHLWDKTKTSFVMSSDGLQVFIRDYSVDVHKKSQLIYDVLSQMTAMKQAVGKIWLNGHLIWQAEYKG